MSRAGYKKYMKKDYKKENSNSLLMLFLVSFIGMLVISFFIIKLIPTVDTSCGGEAGQEMLPEETINIDNRLAAIQNEDAGRNFADFMKDADDKNNNDGANLVSSNQTTSSSVEEPKTTLSEEMLKNTKKEPIYKVFIGTYSTAEQAKVVKDIIQESGLNLNPIVKCIGSNNYTLQVGIYKNKVSADALLATILQKNLPGRIVQED